jgi:4-hydroxythreonine-4-phosphate dehydrogenase
LRKPTIAISIGDPNGVGLQILLESHKQISKFCKPIYCTNKNIIEQASQKLNIEIPKNFNLSGNYSKVSIKPGKVSKKAGLVSYESFFHAIQLAQKKAVDSIVTLPINKSSWSKAGIKYVGHTDMLRDIFKVNAIMMLGCQEMFVALYTEHTPLKEVPKTIKSNLLEEFYENFIKAIGNYEKPIAVLGLNPHNGDNGVLGNEEYTIKKAIKKTNKKLNSKLELVVPDIAFTPHVRKHYKYFIAMYHDQGLGPLKALHFEESINVSLNLPILRTSVDHGTAFDIAYKNKKVSNLSYINAIKAAINFNH